MWSLWHRVIGLVGRAKPTKSSDLKLIVNVCYTEEIADVFIPYVVLFDTMHGKDAIQVPPTRRRAIANHALSYDIEGLRGLGFEWSLSKAYDNVINQEINPKHH
jgi:hypothetical protein